MSVTVTPLNAANVTAVEVSSPVLPGDAANAAQAHAAATIAPLFDDIAANTSNPLPSLAGC